MAPGTCDLHRPALTADCWCTVRVQPNAHTRSFLCGCSQVSASDLSSKYQGEGTRAVKQLFSDARARAPTIIFIDEVDSVGRARQAGENQGAVPCPCRTAQHAARGAVPWEGREERVPKVSRVACTRWF